MEFRNLLNVQNRDELRQWLLENYNKEPECWVVVKRGSISIAYIIIILNYIYVCHIHLPFCSYTINSKCI